MEKFFSEHNHYLTNAKPPIALPKAGSCIVFDWFPNHNDEIKNFLLENGQELFFISAYNEKLANVPVKHKDFCEAIRRIENIQSKINPVWNLYEKLSLFLMEICKNTDYNSDYYAVEKSPETDYTKSMGVYQTFAERESICFGVNSALKYLCDSQGIKSEIGYDDRASGKHSFITFFDEYGEPFRTHVVLDFFSFQLGIAPEKHSLMTDKQYEKLITSLKTVGYKDNSNKILAELQHCKTVPQLMELFLDESEKNGHIMTPFCVYMAMKQLHARNLLPIRERLDCAVYRTTEANHKRAEVLYIKDNNQFFQLSQQTVDGNQCVYFSQLDPTCMRIFSGKAIRTVGKSHFEEAR